MKGRLVGAVAFAGLFFSLTASAEITKDQCIEANTSGQALRRRAKISAAQQQFKSCIDAACPEIIRTDCAQRLDEVLNAQPTIVFDVKSGAGADLPNVTIKVDGAPLAATTEGAAMNVDPGAHEFTFEVPNERPVVRTFILKEGEKGRRERVTIGEAPPPPPVAPPVTPPGPVTPAEPERDGSGQRLGAVIGGAVGLAALGVGAVFGVKAIGDSGDQKDKCKTTINCSDRSAALKSHDDASTAATLSTVLMISGGVVLAGAAVIYLLAPHKTTTTAILRQAIGGIEF